MGDAGGQQNGETVQHVSVDVEQLNKDLADSMKAKLGSLNHSPSGSQCSIYRIQEKVRRINDYAYTPEMISIGPFHRGQGTLPAMEYHKWRYVHALLPTTETGEEQILKQCIESIRNMEEEARKYYSEPINMNSNEFVEMMLVDGLFIIELFRKSARTLEYHEKDDPIFGYKWGLSSLVRDLILLENQIPMIVLNCLLNLPALREQLQGPSFTKLALHFFSTLMPNDNEALKTHKNFQGKHLLDFLGKSIYHNLPVRGKTTNKPWEFVPNVTELKLARFKFKKGNANGSFLDIKFSDGVMEIPPIIIQDQTDALFRNLIASEQYCCGKQVTYMTSYAFFLDSLISSSDDVALLRNQGIITNYLGNDEDVSILISKLCCELTLTNFYYDELCDQVNKYYVTRWHKWRATLKRDYFDNPWATLSVIAAVVLLVLTLTSSIFASLSYIVHKS